MLIALDMDHMLHLWMGIVKVQLDHVGRVWRERNPSKSKWTYYRQWMLERSSTNTHSTPNNHLENAQKKYRWKKMSGQGPI